MYGEGSSERYLKWGGGGSLKDLSKNILKEEVSKVKVVHRGEGVLKVSPPLLPPENFNHKPIGQGNLQRMKDSLLSIRSTTCSHI